MRLKLIIILILFLSIKINSDQTNDSNNENIDNSVWKSVLSINTSCPRYKFILIIIQVFILLYNLFL